MSKELAIDNCYYLEKRQEEVQLLFGRSTVKAVTTGVQESADQANSEKVIWQIQWVQLPRDWRTALYIIISIGVVLVARFGLP